MPDAEAGDAHEIQRNMETMACTVQQTLKLLGFIEHPYLAYTEHGLHALFFTDLYERLLPEDRYTYRQGRRVCVLQKEYPTSAKLGKPQRQHWDIAVLKTPAESISGSYDHLKLTAVVEFGINEAEAHLNQSHGENAADEHKIPE